MKAKMQALWDYVFNVLFDEKTNLIYDQRTTYEKDGQIAHLPTPEEIALQVPNPCSWGSGMEDSMIHGGLMLDTVLNRYEATGEPEMAEHAEKLLKGIFLCAEISGRRGFLARSVSPCDGKSFFLNTSRDQYTHVIYSLLRYMKSSLCSAEYKARIKDTLLAFAERVEADATLENDYQLMRADGKRGLVCRMWKVLPHEALRLPMFYLAAWAAGNGDHWLELYRHWREPAIARTLEGHSAGNQFILIQEQFSARLLYDYDPDPEYKERHLAVLRYVAEQALSFQMKVTATPEEINGLATQWRKCMLRYEWDHVVVNGYDYPIPKEPSRDFSKPIREVGSALVTIGLCPGLTPPERLVEQFREGVEQIDPATHATATPIHLTAGYWYL